MTQLTCRLAECEHEIAWGETPETPGTDLPWVGRVVWCPECEADQTIEEVEPSSVCVEDFAPGPDVQDRVGILYLADEGRWAYEFHGRAPDGTGYATENPERYPSAAAARDAAIEAWEKETGEEATGA